MVPIAGRIMRLTKKAAALLVAAAMVMSMGTTVFADETGNGENSTTDDKTQNVTSFTNPATNTTNLTYTVSDGYTWTVPKDITFTNTKGNTDDVVVDQQKVTVDNCVIPYNNVLTITVAGDGTSNAFTIKDEKANASTLNYEIKLKDTSNALEVSGTVLTVEAGTKSGEKEMSFTLKTKSTDETKSEIAGTYKGTATFTATVAPKSGT